jgi:hypothetical protein
MAGMRPGHFLWRYFFIWQRQPITEYWVLPTSQALASVSPWRMHVTTSAGAELVTIVSPQVCGAAIRQVIRTSWAMPDFPPNSVVGLAAILQVSMRGHNTQ